MFMFENQLITSRRSRRILQVPASRTKANEVLVTRTILKGTVGRLTENLLIY